MAKDIQIPFRVDQEGNDLINTGLEKAKKEENSLLTRTAFLLWLVQQYVNNKKGV